MTGREVMLAARGFIAKGWTRGESARNAEGDRVNEHSNDAVCWCIEGALNRASEPTSYPGRLEAFAALTARVREDGSYALWVWNDTDGRTQAEVLDLLDRTVAEFER